MFQNSLIRRPSSEPAYSDPARFFNSFFDSDFFRPGPLWGARGADLSDHAWTPSVDSRQTKEAFIVDVDLPGLTKDDIHVAVENNVLTLSGERQFTKETEGNGYDRVERAYGKFSRSFTLPTSVDAENVNATFKDGVLTVTIPKSEKARSRHIKVQ